MLKRLKYIIPALLMTVLLAGCTATTEMVNTAFLNSQLMVDVRSDIQEQVQIINELHRMGLIPDTMKYNLELQLADTVKASETLFSDSKFFEAGADPDSVAGSEDSEDSVAVDIGDQHNLFIVKVLQSMKTLGDGPEGAKLVTDLKETKDAKANLEKFGRSYLDMYNGYYTKAIIRQTSYNGIGGYLKDNIPVPLAPFGTPGNSTITALVEHLNSLSKIKVYMIDPVKVPDTAALQGLKKAMDEAKKDSSQVDALALDYFTSTGKTIKLLDKDLSEKDAYSLQLQKVVEGGREVASYEIYKLNKDVLLGAYAQGGDSGDFDAGVLIGNKFFITRYPVAVFRGFQRHATETAKYIPVFTHPYFLQADGEYKTESGEVLSGSLFEGSPSAYVDSLKSGDKGTAETKRAYIDLYTGVMYYDGEIVGNAHEYMGTGSAGVTSPTGERLSSVLVRSSGGVYTVENNPTVITTVSPEDKATYIFTPKETFQIGKSSAINPPLELPTKEQRMPVVFLMEYLELLYSPGTVGSDAFTAYGRKIRLDDKYILGSKALSAGTPPTVAYIVGEGVTPNGWRSKTGYNALSITDFVDIDGFYNEDLSAKIKDVNSEPNIVTSSVRYIGGAPNYTAAGTIQSGDAASERSDGLPQIAAGSGIECVLRFGATNLNSADSSSTPKVPLYGITVYGDLYDRGLFSEWVNVSGNANIIQWATTLKELGYPNYILSDATLTERMKGNYAFELNEDGILNLDLDTVIEINKGLVEERKSTGVRTLRTVLIILGSSLVSYVSVLLAAWSLDVNLDFGLNLLEKASLGHFVAVRSLDEMPPPDPYSTTTYVDFRSLIFKCIAFAVVGVVLISIDPVNLIIKVLGSLNFLIQIISEKVFGTTIM